MIDFGALTLGPAIDAFGEPVTYQPASGNPAQLNAIFDARYRRTKYGDRGEEIVSFAPMLGCQASAFPSGAPTRDELFVVRDRLYRVAEADPDGFGHILVELKLAPVARS